MGVIGLVQIFYRKLRKWPEIHFCLNSVGIIIFDYCIPFLKAFEGGIVHLTNSIQKEGLTSAPVRSSKRPECSVFLLVLDFTYMFPAEKYRVSWGKSRFEMVTPIRNISVWLCSNQLRATCREGMWSCWERKSAAVTRNRCTMRIRQVDGMNAVVTQWSDFTCVVGNRCILSEFSPNPQD